MIFEPHQKQHQIHNDADGNRTIFYGRNRSRQTATLQQHRIWNRKTKLNGNNFFLLLFLCLCLEIFSTSFRVSHLIVWFTFCSLHFQNSSDFSIKKWMEKTRHYLHSNFNMFLSYFFRWNPCFYSAPRAMHWCSRMNGDGYHLM